jgi:hypothetical protein
LLEIFLALKMEAAKCSPKMLFDFNGLHGIVQQKIGLPSYEMWHLSSIPQMMTDAQHNTK